MNHLPRPPASLALLRDLERIVGKDGVSQADGDRLAYSRDAWTRNILKLRADRYENTPDFVVWPQHVKEVSRVLALAAQTGIPVVPYGTGTGNMGGAQALRGGIVLDIKRLKRVRRFSYSDLQIECEAGILSERLERWLNFRGCTLGFEPSTMTNGTLGGWLAARAAGSMYGSLEEKVYGAEVAGPGHLRRFIGGPRPAPIPNWASLVLGSEGCFGVLTSALMRVRRIPAMRRFASYRFPSLARGIESLRQLLKAGVKPSIIRLYDTFDPHLFQGSQNESDNASALALETLLPHMTGGILSSFPGVRGFERLRRFATRKAAQTAFRSPFLLNKTIDLLSGESLLLLGFEGEPRCLRAEAQVADEIILSEGGDSLGPELAEEWFKYRFEKSFRDARLYAVGLFADVFGVAATWDRLSLVHRAVKRAMAKEAVVTSHLTHVCAEGCAIEFTVIGAAGDPRDVSEALERYDRLSQKVLVAVHETGGSMVYHQGFGDAKASVLSRELGVGGARLLSAVAYAFDPNRVLNPRKMGIDIHTPLRAKALGQATLPKVLGSAVGERNIFEVDGQTTIRPPDERALAAVLRVAHARGVRLVSDQSCPASKAAKNAVQVDFTRFDRIPRISERSSFVEVEVGVKVERLEAVLAAHNLTLGPIHPRARSMSVGAALTRSMLIRRSVGFGDLTSLCLSGRGLLPTGETFESRPQTSMGPRIEGFLTNCQSRFAVMTKATLRIVRQPTHICSILVAFDAFESAMEVATELLQTGLRPTAARAWSSGETGWLALKVVGMSEQLLNAQFERVEMLSKSYDGVVCKDNEDKALAGRFDATLEVEVPWSALKALVERIEWMSWGEVWVDFMTPEAATIVVRARDRKAREAALEIAQQNGGRVLAFGGAEELTPSFEQLSLLYDKDAYPFDDVGRALSEALDPSHVLS